jgi:hypothetical protein
MSSETVFTCDRCGEPCGHKVYEFKALVAAKPFPGVTLEEGDLCATCSRSFGKWLRTPKEQS